MLFEVRFFIKIGVRIFWRELDLEVSLCIFESWVIVRIYNFKVRCYF